MPTPTAAPTGGRLRSVAIRELNRSANPAPPDHFDSLSAARDYFAPFNAGGSREYRAIAMLESPTVVFASSDPPTASLGEEMGVGYTPVRVRELFAPRAPGWFRKSTGRAAGLVWQNRHGSAGLIGPVGTARPAGSATLGYLAGVGVQQEPTVELDAGGSGAAIIRYRAEFKLSALPNLFGRLFTGYWAPHAWMALTFTVARGGAFSLDVVATAVPSLRLYASHAPGGPLSVRDVFDMRSISSSQFSAFMHTRKWGCRPAPAHAALNWRGRASCR
jgi:hypothetical protein